MKIINASYEGKKYDKRLPIPIENVSWKPDAVKRMRTRFPGYHFGTSVIRQTWKYAERNNLSFLQAVENRIKLGFIRKEE